MSVRALALVAFGLGLGGAAHAQTPFTDWSSVLRLGSPSTATGVAQEFAYRSGASGVTSVDPPSTNMAITFSQTLGATGDISSLTLQHANRTVSFHRANGDTFTSFGSGLMTYARASDWTREAVSADPLPMGWSYQSFSVWQSGVGQANGSMGGASYGAITPGTSVPQTGTALFFGLMGGLYNDPTGQGYAVAAEMLLGVNFGAHTAEFRTLGTADRHGRARPELDISGTFVSLPNHPALFGTLQTSSMSGTSSAQFYGPTASEVGGVFTLTPKSGTGLERLAGAFGGKRSTSTPAPFTSWLGAVAPGLPYTVTATGKAEVLSFASGAGVVSPPADASFRKTVGSNGLVTGFAFDVGGETVDISGDKGDYVGRLSADFGFGASADDKKVVLVADALGIDWNYQTFGSWEVSEGENVTSLGAASVGAATPASGIPTTGSALFTGLVGGEYIDPSAQNHGTSASMTLTADFGARQASFKSGDLTDIVTDETFAGTALSGTLALAPGQNLLTGVLSTANGRLSGTATGRFYGQLAQEVGGTFILAPAAGSIERMVGGFGGKR